VFLGRDFGSTPNYSDETAAKIDREIKKIIDESYNLAKELLTKYREKLDFITEFLLRNEIMDDEQFEAAMKEGATLEEVEALMTEKKKRSIEENERRARKLEEEKRQAEEERKRLERELGLSDDEGEKSEEMQSAEGEAVENIEDLTQSGEETPSSLENDDNNN
jgi:cell division protease FtsH